MIFKFKKGAQLITLLSIFLVIITSTLVYAVPVKYGAEPDPNTNKSAESFIDVPVNHWAYNMIADMTDLKAVSGYPDGKFQPDRIVTRAEFAAIIVKAAGLEAQRVTKSSFIDVKPTDWYSPYIEGAKDYLTGYRNPRWFYNFNPNAPAIREDMIVAVVRLKGYDIHQANQSTIKAMFTDFEGISEAARNYVAIAVENGLASGNSDGTFKPQKPITRAEAAALLWRAFVYGSDTKLAAPQLTAPVVLDGSDYYNPVPAPQLPQQPRPVPPAPLPQFPQPPAPQPPAPQPIPPDLATIINEVLIGISEPDLAPPEQLTPPTPDFDSSDQST